MIILSLILIVVVMILLWYIDKQNKEIKSYQDTWIKIEEISDHNKDGDIVIHVKEKYSCTDIKK
jgi:hypothetical protein